MHKVTLGRRWYERGALFEQVVKELKNKRSPDQIAGRMKQQGIRENDRVSCQSIYNYLKVDKYAGGTLYKLLRYQGKKYKWRGFDNTDKTRIPNRRGIEDRPTIVDEKRRPE